MAVEKREQHWIEIVGLLGEPLRVQWERVDYANQGLQPTCGRNGVHDGLRFTVHRDVDHSFTPSGITGAGRSGGVTIALDDLRELLRLADEAPAVLGAP